MGRFFEDYRVGETIRHAVPRTLGLGERALYHALYPARHAVHSSGAFARSCGLASAPLDDLIVFHTVFGKTVPDISRNAIANLGYGEGRFLGPVWPGADIHAESEVIGLREASSKHAGIVWVRTTGYADGEPCLSYVRWVLVRKTDWSDVPAPDHVPEIAGAVDLSDLAIPDGLTFEGYDWDLAGGRRGLTDYAPGEIVPHDGAVTVEEAEHMMATRLWQNTAKVHFDATLREDGRRLVYGGHVISMARALSFDGLENAQLIAGLNAGTHANPCFAGTTIRAFSEVLEVAEPSPGIGALRTRLVATSGDGPGPLRDEAGKYRPEILLDLDLWLLGPA